MNTDYKKIAQWYDKNSEYYANKSAILLHDQLEIFLKNIPTGGRILDIGSGPGHDTEYFAKNGFKVVGIDFSSKMIEFSKKNRKGGAFKRMNMLDLKKNFSKDYFNGIWMSSSLTHLKNSDIINVLKQAREIIKPRGVIVVIVKKRLKRKLKNREIIFRQFYKKEIINLLKQSKLSIVRLEDFDALGKKWLFVVAKNG